ncbi:MAG TPA: MFS transporter [Chitinophagaceae bacterium]|nr:MFS transporter [Chitinophagaceae bacterium]
MATTLITAPKKVVRAWTMYDWANSVYNLVVTSTIFPAYYESLTGDGNPLTPDYVQFLGKSFDNTALYNYALSFGFAIVAILSPLLSSISDYKGSKKGFLRFFMTMGSIGCSMLFFYGKDNLALGLTCTIIACIGYWSSIVFYNSYLPEIAAPEDRDRISAKGFSMGYIGSVLLQLVSLVLIMKGDLFGINAAEGSRISFLLVGIWWLGFGTWAVGRLPKPTHAGTVPNGNILLNGYRELGKVWDELKHLKVLKAFLGAYFFYNMGVQTVMLSAPLYASDELGVPQSNLIISILILQLIAIVGATAISKLSSLIGNIKALIICVVFWIYLCYFGYTLPSGNVNMFYILAVQVGFVMGGIQALSRSTYAKLMPITKDTASFFSFFDVAEKVGIVIGLFLFGYLTEETKSQRLSVLSCMTFFIIGMVFLLVTLKRMRHEAARH